MSNRRILVIDDNPAIHEDFRKILRGDAAASTLTTARAALFDDIPLETPQEGFGAGAHPAHCAPSRRTHLGRSRRGPGSDVLLYAGGMTAASLCYTLGKCAIVPST